MRNAQLARLFGAGALAAALLLVPGCRDNASNQVNAPELQQPPSEAPGTGGSGSAGTEAAGAGTGMSGRPATGSTERGTQSDGGTDRTPPGHELDTR